MYSGTEDVLLCQFTGPFSSDITDCQTSWEMITVVYEQGGTDGDASTDLTNVVEVSAT